ncbi:MAG: DNA polymerase III subunit gamma/tau [Thermodesulfobacteriota bacterium]
MSYLVLARKWRPQVFEEVVGQRHITQTLQNAISQKRVAHAFLFAGARGVGKTSTARILAKALNCERGPDVNPCNQCTSCREISSGTSMDVIEIDGASNRGIDEIRELRENVRYTPAKSRYKIYIIDEVHMLTREAFNALLKTLEEPPPHIIFVFATTEPHKIPATILSRCQRYDFKRIPLKEIMESLKRIVEEEKVRIGPRGLFAIAQQSEGSLRDAQSLLDQVISYGGKEIREEDIVEVLGLIDRKILYDTIEAIGNRSGERCMEIVESVYHYGYDLQHFCRELLQYFRNLILMKVSAQPEGFIELPEEEWAILKKQAEKFQFDHLNHLFTLLLKGEEEVAQSTFPRIMLEMTLLRMATLRPFLPIDDILKRLEGLGKAGPHEQDPCLHDEERFGTQASSLPQPAVGRKGELVEPQRPTAESRGPGGRAEYPIPKSTPKKLDDLEGREGPAEKVEEMGPSPSESTADANDSAGERVSGGSSEQVREEAWRGLVDFTRSKNPVLGSFIALGDLIDLNDVKIEIGFEKDSFHYERMIEKENRSQLESMCQEYFRKKMKVIISHVNQGGGPKGRIAPEAREAVQNPIIQEALRLFNGRIIED